MTTTLREYHEKLWRILGDVVTSQAPLLLVDEVMDAWSELEWLSHGNPTRPERLVTACENAERALGRWQLWAAPRLEKVAAATVPPPSAAAA